MAHLSYDDKGKVFYFRNKYEPRNINAVEISEESITKISKIASAQNAGLGAAGEKESHGNSTSGKTCGSA